MKTNRDAIGARVELLPAAAGGRLCQIKSMRAGDGYLSQSSRWLHFGLGDRREGPVRSVAIRWPSGETETVGGLVPGGRYVITQGSGKGTIAPGRGATAPLEEAAPATFAPPPGGGGRAIFSTRFALPDIEFEGATEDREALETRQLSEFRGGPLLVVLWASWCAPCLAELGEIAREGEAIRDAGLRVLALNVEGAAGDGEAAGLAGGAKAKLDDLSYSGPWGVLDQHAAEGIELFLNTMFVKQSSLTIPVSLLLDADGRAVALYRGQVDLQTVLDDLGGHAGAPPAPPFDGRRHAAAPPLTHFRLATRFAEQGRIDEAVAYLARIDPGADHSGDSYRVSAFYNLGVSYARTGKIETAADYYRRAIEANASFAPAHFNLAILLERQGADQGAIGHYRKAIEIAGGHPDASNNLGLLYRSLGDFEKATACFDEALAADPRNVPALNNLANLSVVRGKFDDAEIRLGEALASDPDDPITHSNLGFLQETRGEFGAAAESYREAAKLQPRNLDHHKSLALVLARAGKFDEAELAMQVGLAEVPERADAAMDVIEQIRRMRER